MYADTLASTLSNLSPDAAKNILDTTIESWDRVGGYIRELEVRIPRAKRSIILKTGLMWHAVTQ